MNDEGSSPSRGDADIGTEMQISEACDFIGPCHDLRGEDSKHYHRPHFTYEESSCSEIQRLTLSHVNDPWQRRDLNVGIPTQIPA